MSKITPKQLAEACRSLAQDLEDGKGPVLGSGRTWTYESGAPNCAIGHALHRAGDTCPSLPPESVIDQVSVVVHANDWAVDENRAQAVVRPLRDLADALDAEPA